MKLEGLYGALLALPLSAPALVLADSEPEPAYANVQMEGLPYEGENCEGGDWSLNWRGPVYVENGPLADLLISYTAFDTSHPGQRTIPSVKFQSNKVTCRDNDGKVIMTANISQKKLKQGPAHCEPCTKCSIQLTGIYFFCRRNGRLQSEFCGHLV